MENPVARKPWYRVLYLQVLVAVALGIAVGYFWPGFGKSLKPLGDGFVKIHWVFLYWKFFYPLWTVSLTVRECVRLVGCRL